MNTTEKRAGEIGAVAGRALFLLLLCLALFSCQKAYNAPRSAAEAVRLVDFTCGPGRTERVEPWGRSGASRGCYREDVRDGPIIFWEEGYVNLDGRYRDGVKDGTWTVFNDNGSVFVEIVFDRGSKMSKTYH